MEHGSAEWQPDPPVRFAGLIWRSIALTVDLGVLVLWVAGLRAIGSEPPASLFVPVLSGAGWLLYFPVAWGLFGATVGMRLLGLKVVREGDGGPIDYGVAVRRFLVFLPSVLLAFVLIGLLLALPLVFDRRRRALHDRIARTVVVRRPYQGDWPWWLGPW